MSHAYVTAIAVMLGLMDLAAEADNQILWQIGQPDHSFRDLAFKGDLNTYTTDFPEDVTFHVGKDDPAKSFCGQHPGARDKWAGRREHAFRIRFDMDHEPAGVYLLTIDLVDTDSQLPPTYRVRINDTEALRVLDYGTGELALLRPEQGMSRQLRYVIKARQLKQGANMIELCSVRGSWLLYDALTMARLSPEADIPIAMHVQPTVFFVERGGHLKREFRLTADGIMTSETATLEVRDGTQILASITPHVSPLGTIDAAAHVPPTDRPRILTFTLIADRQRVTCDVEQRPQKKWQLFVAPTVHVDIGYTHLQRDVIDIHNRNTTFAMELNNEFPGFFFNQECIWPVENWLRDQPSDRKTALFDELRERRMGIAGVYVNLLTGLCSQEELIRSLYDAARMNREQGTPFDTAMLTDSPSHVWSWPSVLAGAGIRYLSVGVNDIRAPLFRKNIHHKNPFWWEGPDGQRVLTWFAVGYGFRQSSRLGIRPEIGRMEVAIEKEVQWWDDRGDYPYDAIYYHGLYGDNQFISRNLPEKVAAYNSRYAYPKVILCEPAAFFSHIEKRFSERIPTLRGCGGSWWEDGAGSSAFETQLNRRTHQDLDTAERVWSVALPRDQQETYPRHLFEEAWRNMLLYDEHTWGASESITEPTSDFVTRQWAVKANFALSGADQSRHLLNIGMQRLAERVQAPDGSLLVFNSSGQPRTGLVHACIPRDHVIVDGQRVIPHQVITQDESEQAIIFVAPNVPAAGYRTWNIRPGTAATSPSPPPNRQTQTLENVYYRITLDTRTGAIASLIDKQTRKEIVDQDSAYQLGQLIYAAGGEDPNRSKWDTPNRKLVTRTSPRCGSIEYPASGPIFTSAACQLEHDAFNQLAVEITLYENVRRVDFTYRLDKKMTFDKEAVYVAFPVAGSSARFAYEVGGAAVTPGTDHLPGACFDWFAVQRWVSAKTDESTVVWTPVDTPLVTLGEMTPGQWATDFSPGNGTIFAYTMNNYWCTNYKAGQSGEMTFRYSLTSNREIKPSEAGRFGESVVSPMRAVRLHAGRKRPDLPPIHSFLQIQPETVELVAMKIAEGGQGIIIRLHETAGRTTPVTIITNLNGIDHAAECNLVEGSPRPITVQHKQCVLELQPYATKTVHLKSTQLFLSP